MYSGKGTGNLSILLFLLCQISEESTSRGLSRQMKIDEKGVYCDSLVYQFHGKLWGGEGGGCG